MRGISEAFGDCVHVHAIEKSIAARKYAALHEGHQVRSRLDERGSMTYLCVDCFELVTFYHTRPGPECRKPELRAAYFRGGAVADVPVWWYFAEAALVEAEIKGCGP